MPSYTRMKKNFLQGLLWLYLTGFGFMALSLEPGFLDFDNLPDTNFSCVGKVIGGYYADLETNCQMFHVCTIGQLDEPMDIRFLCLNGTVFDQETRVCERIDEVDCAKSEQFYSLNLELYGNTQPAILEETSESGTPLIIKTTTTSTTTTTTTTTQRPKPKTTRAQYYTTVTPQSGTTPQGAKHHFPLGNRPDIRFNPEEINISLNPGAPPNIRTKPVSFQQQIYSDSNSHNNKPIVTTHTNSYNKHRGGEDQEDNVQIHPNNGGNVERPYISITTQKPKSVVSYELTHNKPLRHQQPVTASDERYSFTYGPTDRSQDFNTEIPRHNYHYQSNVANFRPSFSNHPSNNHYYTSTSKSRDLKNPTTVKSLYLHTFKPNSYYHHTEKPQRVQLPLPLLPNLSPLTFSSPAPFTLTRHVETKRYTKDHPSPPRIIISASASVSDGAGRRLNYSLGTLGAAQFLEQPPQSYDEYKDDDVGLDPFYHDVPKIKKTRRRRAVELKHSDVIKNEQEAVDVLRFLFDWYKNHEKTSTPSDKPQEKLITQINQELSLQPKNETKPTTVEVEPSTENYKNSELFKEDSKFSLVGNLVKTNNTSIKPVDDGEFVYYYYDYLNEESGKNGSENKATTKKSKLDEIQDILSDYIDDNQEPIVYNQSTTARVYEESSENNSSAPQTEPTTLNLIQDNFKPEVYSFEENIPENKPEVEVVLEQTKMPGSTTKYETPRVLNIQEFLSGTSEVPKLELEPPKIIDLEDILLEPKINFTGTTTEEVLMLRKPPSIELEPPKIIDLEAILGDLPLNVSTEDGLELEDEVTSIMDAGSSTKKDGLVSTLSEGRSTGTIEFIPTLTSLAEETESSLGTTDFTPTVTSFRNEVLDSSTTQETPTRTSRTTTRRSRGRSRFHINSQSSSRAKARTVGRRTSTTSTTSTTTSSTTSSSTTTSSTTSTTHFYTTTTTQPPPPPKIEISVDPATTTETLETTTFITEPPITLIEEQPETTTLLPNMKILAQSTLDSIETTEIPSEPPPTTTQPPTNPPDVSSQPPTTRRIRPTRRPTLRRPHSPPRHRFSTDRRPKPPEPPPTDSSLDKSASPTQADSPKQTLTTPLTLQSHPSKSLRFNCFGKPINKFYPDARDCRLFHYCTQGYNKNQLLDMKFVCDLSTFYDDEKLICTKTKPARCL